MSVAGHQTLRVLDGSYVLDRPADVTEVIPRADVLAIVFGPDGSTVMRRDDTGEDAWSALWNGDEAHDVQATGMLSAIVAPLAAGGVPVWVVSSYDGDLVLVPTDRLDEASEVLQAAAATKSGGSASIGGHVRLQPTRITESSKATYLRYRSRPIWRRRTSPSESPVRRQRLATESGLQRRPVPTGNSSATRSAG